MTEELKGQRPDEMGADDEQPAERGGGNGAGGVDLQLKDEPEESAGGDELPAFLDEKQIMAIIANKDDDLKYKKNQIELFFLGSQRCSGTGGISEIRLSGPVH